MFEGNLILTHRVAAAPSDTFVDANFGLIWVTVDRMLDGFLAMPPLLAAAIVISVLLLFAARGVGIGYGDDLAEAKRIALEAIKRVDGVLAAPAPDVLVWELGESAKNIRLRWSTKPARADVLRIRDSVLKGVAEAIADAGMDLPFPTQVARFDDQTEETDGDRNRQREGWPAGKNPPKPRYPPPRDDARAPA